jgi:hypothetical protein
MDDPSKTSFHFVFFYNRITANINIHYVTAMANIVATCEYIRLPVGQQAKEYLSMPDFPSFKRND